MDDKKQDTKAPAHAKYPTALKTRSMLDIGTLFFCALTAQSILTVLTALVFYGRFRDGMGFWVIAGGLEVLGWLIFLFSSALPKGFSAVIAASLLSLCLGFIRASLKQFFNESVPHYQIWGFAALCVVQQWIWIDSDEHRIIFTNLVMAGQVLWCGSALVQVRHDGTQRSRHLMVLGLLLLFVCTLSRALLTLWWPETMPNLRAPTPVNVWAFLFTFVSVIIVNVSYLTMHQDRAWHTNLQLAMSDQLTGLLNRRALLDVAGRAISTAQRLESGLVVMLIDIDYFKRINDELGHPVGDLALRKFADVLQAQARQSDWVARYGGEEFCVLMPHSDVEDAQQLAHRLRKVLLAEPLQPYDLTLRFSAGICAWSPRDTTLDNAIELADAALYRAKQKGRDRVEVELAL